MSDQEFFKRLWEETNTALSEADQIYERSRDAALMDLLGLKRCIPYQQDPAAREAQMRAAREKRIRKQQRRRRRKHGKMRIDKD